MRSMELFGGRYVERRPLDNGQDLRLIRCREYKSEIQRLFQCQQPSDHPFNASVNSIDFECSFNPPLPRLPLAPISASAA